MVGEELNGNGPLEKAVDGPHLNNAFRRRTTMSSMLKKAQKANESSGRGGGAKKSTGYGTFQGPRIGGDYSSAPARGAAVPVTKPGDSKKGKKG